MERREKDGIGKLGKVDELQEKENAKFGWQRNLKSYKKLCRNIQNYSLRTMNQNNSKIMERAKFRNEFVYY